jgi:hypothetical protein
MQNDMVRKTSFYKSEPIAYLLSEKLRFSPFSLALISIPITTAIALFTAWVSNTLWSKPEQIGLLQTWVPWLILLLFNPIIWGYYLWSFQAINNVIQSLKESDVLEIDKLEIEQIVLKVYWHGQS